MEHSYSVVVSLEALDILPRTGKRRESVLDYLKGLKDFAYLGGDFQLKDPESLRVVEVSLISGYAVTWWIDSPVNQVMVVDIRPAS